MFVNRFYYAMLMFLLGLLGYLTYQIMSPFFTAIAWAVVFSIVFYPVYAFLLKNLKIKALASVLTLILIFMVIIGPFTYLFFILVGEIQLVASKINNDGVGSVQAMLENLKSSSAFGMISGYTGLQDYLSDAVILDNLKKAGKGLVEGLSVRIPNIISAIVNFIFMLLATFFLFKDGPGFLFKIKDYMPFNEAQKDRLAVLIKDMIVSTVYGGVVVAVIQGILGGLAFYFIGLEAPVMWGFAMAIMSFVPLLGTFAIWGPTAAYLAVQGNYIQGGGLFIFGLFVIGTIDNILKPLIIGSRTSMHTIVILFSVLGGIRLFGMIGLIMGPLITAVFVSVFEIFRNIEGVDGK